MTDKPESAAPSEHDDVIAIVGASLGEACDAVLRQLLGDAWESLGLVLVMVHPDAPECVHVSSRLDQESIEAVIAALTTRGEATEVPMPRLGAGGH